MRNIFNITSIILCIVFTTYAQSYPSLILTKDGIDKMKSSEHPPSFAKSLSAAIEEVDLALQSEIDVPIPKDMAGGYSHEQHKNNYKIMHLAGALYHLTGEEKYAQYIQDVLVKYAEIFPSLTKHPAKKSYSRGKLFWQCLNDANWLVYTSQAYDAVYNFIPKKTRDILEKDLFRPYADFISMENPYFFNRVHNHSTWGNAGVGMIGLVMNDKELIDRALYGLPIEQINKLKNNDGRFTYEGDKIKAGFFAQIDYAFSPDGYYTEGPYYQRYAMLPFMVFAQALDNKRPDLKIFEYRNGLLPKAVKALLYQTNSDGEFFPINDAQKGMSIKSTSVITAVNIAFGATGDEEFVAASNMQGAVLLDQNGFELAKRVAKKPNQTFKKKAIELSDGKDGTEGALGILRTGEGDKEMTVVFKYTAQGLGHGHYDKLSYSFYDGSTEVFQDYGAARWVNVDQKSGGRYLPENKTWSKHTISHNTIVADQTSHFKGDYSLAVDAHSIPIIFDVSDPNFQYATAKEINAYNDVEMQRTLVLWTESTFQKPILIDLIYATSENEHTYELPYHHAGQIMDQSFDYSINMPSILGDSDGYQHVFQEAKGKINDHQWHANWMKDSKFYTVTGVSKPDDEILYARIGANDPNFNLRKDPFIIHKKVKSTNATFLSVIESHGSYTPVTEIPDQPYGLIKSIVVEKENESKIFFNIATDNQKWSFIINKQNGVVSKI